MLPLTGRTVTISGKKADGTPIVGRTLSNCSYPPGKGISGHLVVGMDISIGQIRSFRLVDINVQLRLGGPQLKGLDLATTIEFHLKHGRTEIRKVFLAEDAA